ncbi:MAG: hypothetical protein A2503_01900 [Burkholderiales bacterium RIFOXYD12_FULL_59_19]|nr:MAG: hypothetical protein A2503_01900 [Burkholderiales bacterium RIFOXYD12_FULL_59_19]
MDMKSFTLLSLGGSGQPGHFASCPPAYGLLLYLRKAPGQPAPELAVWVGPHKAQKLIPE